MEQQVTFRNIARMMAKAMPVEGKEFTEKIAELAKAISGMSKGNKSALRSAYIFSQKVPQEEREDMFQELFLTLWQAQVKDEKLAYTIARCDWRNWWQAYAYRQHYSLDSVVEDENGNQVPYGELLVGEVEYERLDGEIDGERLYESLPNWVKRLVNKRLEGRGLTGGDKRMLDKWVASKPLQLITYQS